MNRRDSLQYLAALGMVPLAVDLDGIFNLRSLAAGYAPVMKRKIPSSGESLPCVGVGTWQTFDVGPGEPERAPLKQVLNILLENGGSVVDSSPMYGRSEAVVGDLSEDLGINAGLFMATKVWTSGKAEGIRQMERSFSLLKRKTIDLMQVHNLLDWQTHLQTLKDWKEKGKVRYTGITHYTESAYPAIEQILKNHSVDFLQLNYSIISRKAEERLLPLALEKGVAVIVNQPYESGSLFRQVKGKALPAWAADFDCASWGQFFLKFILSHPAVTCVIPGTDQPRHMLDNIGAGMGSLPDKTIREKMAAVIRG